MIIAIDGPAGAGKSTISKKIAEILKYIYIDTGSMYRAFTYKLLKNSVDLNDKIKIIKFLSHTKISLEIQNNGSQIILLDNENVTEKIREQDVTKSVSKVAQYQEVRDYFVKMQRELANKGNIVMDGRDIGTNVLPNADVKFYLTANVEERAKRRYLQLKEMGIKTSIKQLIDEITERDLQDSTREVSPLKIADDAIYIDTSDRSLEDVLLEMINIIKKKEGER